MSVVLTESAGPLAVFVFLRSANHPGQYSVFLETSGTSLSCQIKNAYDAVGHERVMFGIGSPFHGPSVEIQKIMACDADEQGPENIFI